MIELDLEKIEIPEKRVPVIEKMAELLDPEEIASIVVYGSATRKEISEISDIDTIIVLKSYDDRRAFEIKKELNDFEAEIKESSRIESKLEEAGGLFLSTFVTYKDSFQKADISEIFDIPWFAKYIFPFRISMSRFEKDHIVIYGEHLGFTNSENLDVEKFWYREFFKSFSNQLFLASTGLVFSLISNRGPHYSMEGYKITVYNCSFLLDESSISLEQGLESIPDFFGFQQLFMDYRNQKNINKVKFVILALICVKLTYFWTLKQKRRESIFRFK